MFVPIRYINQREIIALYYLGGKTLTLSPLSPLSYCYITLQGQHITAFKRLCTNVFGVFCCCSFVLFNEKDCLIQFSHFLGSKIKYCTELSTKEASYILTQGS